MSRVRKEQERTRDKSHIEDVITRTTEYLFGKDNGKSSSNSHHPQRSIDRHNQRNDETRNEKALLNLFFFPLRYRKLNTKSHCVTDYYIRQYCQQAEAECLPPQCTGHATTYQLACSQQVLVAHIEHTEQHSGNKCQNHKYHGAFGVRTIVDLCAYTL